MEMVERTQMAEREGTHMHVEILLVLVLVCYRGRYNSI